MFCIVAKVFGNIKNWFSAHNWLVFGWYVRYLAGLWVGWLVFGWFVVGLAGLWVVWLVWLVRGWFRVLQLTHFKKDFLKNYLKEINRFRSGKTEEKKQCTANKETCPSLVRKAKKVSLIQVLNALQIIRHCGKLWTLFS